MIFLMYHRNQANSLMAAILHLSFKAFPLIAI
jgi:hypothetical protein